MYEAKQESERGLHVFREAEKAVQRKLRLQYGTKGKLVEEIVDLSNVLDLEKLAFDGVEGCENVGRHRDACRGEVRKFCRQFEGSTSVLVYSFERHPGFFIVRHSIDDALASKLADACFGDAVLRPPATTNFNKSHGLWMNGLWDAAMNNLRLVTGTDNEKLSVPPLGEINATEWAPDGTGPPAAEFLGSLRWASIGPCYDWTSRVYRKDQDYVPLPKDMAIFAKRIWALVSGEDHGGSKEAEYTPNAALINYYREGDKLCGHKDDAEIDQTQPLVSISLGCPAVFLMGGESKDVAPTPMILRHGDVAILSGDARRAYHGLPRIFPTNRKHKLVDQNGRRVCVKDGYPPDANPAAPHLPACVIYSRERHADIPPTSPIDRYLLDCRINISIRQV